MTAMVKRLKRGHGDLAWHAWTIAYLGRVEAKSFPKTHKDLLKDAAKPPAKPQTAEEQLAIMKCMFLAFGGDPEQLERLH
jgi:hypothetical protein